MLSPVVTLIFFHVFFHFGVRFKVARFFQPCSNHTFFCIVFAMNVGKSSSITHGFFSDGSKQKVFVSTGVFQHEKTFCNFLLFGEFLAKKEMIIVKFAGAHHFYGCVVGQNLKLSFGIFHSQVVKSLGDKGGQAAAVFCKHVPVFNVSHQFAG